MTNRAITESTQSVFLEQIRNRIPENIALADELAETLNISRDSAYRRIRGETVLSLDEAKKLHDKFGISLDAIFSPTSNMALFHHRALNLEYSLERWLNSIAKNFKMVNGLKEKEMIFAAKDIPVFHYFRLPVLASFKILFWLKTVFKDPNYANQSYREDVIPRDLLAIGARVWNLYATVPSTEIWSDEVINDTLKQIAFYKDCGFFNDPQQPVLICDDLIKLIHLIKEEAAEGRKKDGASFKLFENEILTADNTVFAKMDSNRVVYINYNTLNLLTTMQPSFCEKTEHYLNNLMRSSILISSSAEKERNKFFNKMTSRIEDFRVKLA